MSSAICTDFQPSRCVTARACAVTLYRHGCRPRCSQNLGELRDRGIEGGRVAVWLAHGHRDRGDGPVSDGGWPIPAEPVLVSRPGRHVRQRRAATVRMALPVWLVRVAMGAGVQEERGERGEDHDPEQQEDPHGERRPRPGPPGGNGCRTACLPGTASADPRPAHRTAARWRSFTQQVTEQQERGAAHAQRRGRRWPSASRPPGGRRSGRSDGG